MTLSLAEVRAQVQAEEARAGAKIGQAARTERTMPLRDGITLRGTGEDAPIKIAGHAAVFGRSTDIGGMFTETIKRGAFRDALDAHQDTLMLWDHDTRYPLARTANGTLKLREDPRGLEAYAEIPRELSYARDLEVLIANRTIAGMSFGFTVREDEWTERTADGKTTYYREIISVDRLLDVSPVAMPAYPTTDVGLRSEGRADVPSLAALVEMYDCGLAFIELENDPDDQPDRDAMQKILTELEALMATEATEDESAEPADPTNDGAARSAAVKTIVKRILEEHAETLKLLAPVDGPEEPEAVSTSERDKRIDRERARRLAKLDS